MAHQTEYLRISQNCLKSDAASAVNTSQDARVQVRWSVVVGGILLAMCSTIVTSIASAKVTTPLTSTLIPVIGFAVLMLCVMILNPLLRHVGGRWLRPLNRAELVCIFAALMVTSGIGTFGLVDQLVPVVTAPHNPEWNTPQTGWDESLLPHLNSKLYITDTKLIRAYREGIAHQPGQYESFDKHVAVYIDTIKKIPWYAWVGPLSFWAVFIFGCYGMFYCLAYIVLPYWADKEKLAFPLAKLPEALLPDENAPGRLPPIMRSPLFWVGFALSFLVLNFNGAANADLIPLNGIPLGIDRASFRALVANSVFAGLGGSKGLCMLVFFTAIGIGFLLPLNISFSMWFYFLVGRGLLLVMVWMGYGQNYNDFPDEWLWTQHPSSAMGAGGFLLFSAVILYRCVREYFRLCFDLPKQRRLRVLFPLIGLAISTGIITMFISLNNVPLIWAMLFTLFIALFTLGVMRMTAEGGVFWYQIHASFFHFFKMAQLGKIATTKIIAPLMPIYGVLFLDVKTFMAPNLANAAKMHDDTGGSRLKFHITVILSVIVSVFAGLFTSITIAYNFGAQTMSNWFYTSYPKLIAEKAAQATTMTPELDTSLIGWWVFGAAWTGLSLFVRQTLFWFPHPLGFVMLVNPLMNRMWFSFFIGWVIKKIVITYGGKQTFDIVRKPMIGLILGELIAVLIWIIIGIIDNANYGVTLNRMGS